MSFETHKYLLKRFNLLKCKLHDNQSENQLRIHGEGIVEDFRNTFKVLYATILEGPFEFESSTLVSALRIATAYEYPALRAYAISHLELAQLTAIERVKIAREFGLASWEEPAYVELCERDEPITREEANILGMDMFVRVAEIREQEQRRGKEVDTRRGGVHAVSERVGYTYPIATGLSNSAPQANSTRGAVSRVSGAELGSDGHPDSTQDNSEGLNGTITQGEQGSGGSGGGGGGGSGGGVTRISKGCLISPCVVAALKDIQIQQGAHAKSIVDLELSVSKLIAPPAPLPEVASTLIRPERSKSFVHNAVQIMLSTT